MHTPRFARRVALLFLPLLPGCGGGDNADTSDAGTDGGGSVVVPGGGAVSDPQCVDRGAYVRLTVDGAEGGMFAWEATDFTECHGGGVAGKASLQFDLKGAAGTGTFHITLVDQPQVAVGANLKAEVNLSLDDSTLDVGWREDCVAEITDVTEIPGPDGDAWATGVWSRYTGTVHCDTPTKDRQFVAPNLYTLPSAAFQGISHHAP